MRVRRKCCYYLSIPMGWLPGRRETDTTTRATLFLPIMVKIWLWGQGHTALLHAMLHSSGVGGPWVWAVWNGLIGLLRLELLHCAGFATVGGWVVVGNWWCIIGSGQSCSIECHGGFPLGFVAGLKTKLPGCVFHWGFVVGFKVLFSLVLCAIYTNLGW